ncbi:MAG: glycoside hydrolase family 2 TIM barrel-domain containing protein [Planctomycetia bacterium]|nr:glycoside hydrolase family 2 TIM barrel-domain containing protein [Planctomycetia bacterium]
MKEQHLHNSKKDILGALFLRNALTLLSWPFQDSRILLNLIKNRSCQKKRTLILFFGTILLGLTSTIFAQNPDHWGLIPGTPAVVNSVTVSPHQKILSLRGEWDFVLDQRLMGRHRMGKGPQWNEPDWSGARKINVPGCWEAQGVGEPGISQTWDCVFDQIVRPLNHIFMGTVRYRKEIEIPKDWSNQEIWLKIGGVRSEAWLWVNKKRVANVNNYCGTYKFNITNYVKPGETAEIVATVRNDSPSRKGQMSDFHKFGGFYRDIELEATPPLWIDDVWIASDLDNNAAEIHLTLLNTNAEIPDSLKKPRIQVDIRTLSGQTVASMVKEISLPLTQDELIWTIPIPNCQLWSPENPNLYLADLQLLDAEGQAVHGWTERFGIRKLEVVGKRFYLNGKPYFLRGYGDDFIYPETLITPADKETHLKNMKVLKEAGFNFVRTHTHCEIPEFFEAADEAGILVQPELPYYHDITVESFEFDPMRDIQELYRHYRRYVSFAVYSLGNEGHLGSPIDQELYQWVKKNDPARLMQHQDGGCNTRANSDFDTPNGYLNSVSSIVPWTPGTFDFLDCPFVAHEYLNLSIKLDPRLEPRFTGAILPPRSMKDYEKSLEEVGLNRTFGDACLNAAHGLQAIYQKQGLEQARLDPACDGYSYWTALDVMIPQASTYTAQGFLNAFYEAKPGGLTPTEFAEFNGPTAILATFLNHPQKILVSDQSTSIQFWISHFGFDDLKDKKLSWSIRTDRNILSADSFLLDSIQTGDVRLLKELTLTVPQVEQPVQAELTATLDGTNITNHWKIWIFPQRVKPDLTGYVVSPELFDWMKDRYENVVLYGSSEAQISDALIVSYQETNILLKAIEEGRQILAIKPTDGHSNVSLGWWSLGSQLGTSFAFLPPSDSSDQEASQKHPVFGNFPTSQNINELWFQLIKGGMLDLKSDFPLGKLEPLAVGEGVETYYLYLGQAQFNDARLLISSGLELLQDRPETLSLLDNLIRYIRSDDFSPVKMDGTFLKQFMEKIKRQNELLQKVNGWSKTIRATGFEYSGFYFCGPATLQALRFLDNSNEVQWESQPVPETFSEPKYKVSFICGVGFVPNSPCELELFLNDQPVPILSFPLDVIDREWNVSQGNVSLEYEALWNNSNETGAVMTLTLPAEMVQPGKSLSFKIVGQPDPGNGNKWFAIYER